MNKLAAALVIAAALVFLRQIKSPFQNFKENYSGHSKKIRQLVITPGKLGWFESYCPLGVSSHNNALESTNNVIKNEGTFRLSLSFSFFIEILEFRILGPWSEQKVSPALTIEEYNKHNNDLFLQESKDPRAPRTTEPRARTSSPKNHHQNEY